MISKMDRSHISLDTISHNTGLIWSTVFGLSRGAMYASTKISQDKTEIGTTQILLFTSLMIWLCGYIFGKLNDVNFGYEALQQMPYAIRMSLVKRTVFGYCSIMLTFASIQLMPVSVAVSIMMLLGLTTSLMAYFILGESLSIPELCAIVGGFFGCLMITKSDMFIDDDNPESLELQQRESKDEFNYPFYGWGVFLAFLFCFVAAMNTISMREMGNMVHSSVKTFYFGALSSILTIIFFVFYNPAYLMLWTSNGDNYTFKGDELFAGIVIGFFAWTT